MYKRDLVNWTKKETYIYIPNEIFTDLQQCITTSTHIAFAYSYNFLINYLYRYAKYTQEYKFTQHAIKQFLGYSGDNKRLDYIIKKNGILDVIGYTTTITDYPVEINFDGNLHFVMYSEFKKNNFDELKVLGLHNERNFKIKYPLKAFYRTELAMINEYMNGTFYEVEHTHRIPLEAFVRAMEDEEIGTMGFYIYGFLKYLIDSHGGEWYTLSTVELSKLIGVSNKTFMKYTQILEAKRFIRVVRQDYFHNPEGKANEYMIHKSKK